MLPTSVLGMIFTSILNLDTKNGEHRESFVDTSKNWASSIAEILPGAPASSAFCRPPPGLNQLEPLP
jgi:hypothetical protein